MISKPLELIRTGIVSSVLLVTQFSSMATGDVLFGTATMGDSLSIKAQPYKWPVLLQTYRGFNFGGDNMPYVHAVGGATSSDVLLLREPQKVVSPVQAGKVTSATFLVGGDDYADAGPKFINGTLTGAALTSFENQIVSNIKTATNIVLNSGIEAFILGSVPYTLGEPQAAPLIIQYPAAAAASDASIQRVNAQLLTFAESVHIPYVDFYTFGKLFNGLDHVTVGGVDITFTVGSDPHNFFVDNVHPGYIGDAMIANLWMEAFNIAYGTNLTLFSDQEMLQMAGMTGYTGETFSPTMDYASLIHFSAVPEPSPPVLLVACFMFVLSGGYVLKALGRGYFWQGAHCENKTSSPSRVQ